MANRIAVANRIARQQYEDEDVQEVYCIRSKRGHDDREPIVIVQTSQSSLSAGVIPMFFPAEADRGIPYPYVLIDLTPDEVDDIRRRLDAGKPVKGWRHWWRFGRCIGRPKRTVRA
jgi:hypothetical protein